MGNYYDHAPQALAAQYDAMSSADVHQSWLSVLDSLKPRLALDVGAGSGRDARWLADKGWDVIAVEPSDLRQQGITNSKGYGIEWLNDSMPDLARVRTIGYRFDLILLSAVWQHVKPSERARAFRILTELLNPGGVIVILLRQGTDDEENAARQFYEVLPEELDQYAKDRALRKLLWTQTQDAQRTHVTWGYLAYQIPDDGTGGLSLLRHIIINDDKTATYKLGLLRVLSRIAESYPGAVIKRDDESVTIPLGLVGLLWLKQYKPLILQYQLPQLAKANPSFAKQAFNALVDFSDPELRLGASIAVERGKVLEQALIDACRAIHRNPAHYTTFPGTNRPVFDTRYVSPARSSTGVMVNLEYLSRFGDVKVPAGIWQTLGQYACWLEPAIVHEWQQLMARWDYSVRDRGPSLANAFRWEDSVRFTGQVRARVNELREQGDVIACTWTGKRSKELDIDHAFPWARWPNNDLWNLLPCSSNINAQKSDRLPSQVAMHRASSRIIEWWGRAYCSSSLEQQFNEEALISLPGLSRDALTLESVYEAMLHQRAKIKHDQQLAEWGPR